MLYQCLTGTYIAFIAYKTALNWVKSKMGEKLRHLKKGFMTMRFVTVFY